MKKLGLLLVLLGWVIEARAQTAISTCTAPDSVVAKYRADAYRLAQRKIYRRRLPERDSIRIGRAHVDTVLRALLAVHNATSLPARDTVVDRYDIHSFPAPMLDRLLLAADSSHPWMQQLRAGPGPTGYALLDQMLTTYDLHRDRYSSFAAALGYDVVSFRTDSCYNLPPLTRRLETIPGVRYAVPELAIGDGNNLTDSIYADHVELIYSLGLGDCPAGCTYRRYWKFRAYFDCTVTFVGTYDSQTPLAAAPTAPVLPAATAYPLPFAETLTLSGVATPFDFTLTNALGQSVATGRAVAVPRLEQLGALPAGAYVLTVRAAGRVRRFPVWKQ